MAAKSLSRVAFAVGKTTVKSNPPAGNFAVVGERILCKRDYSSNSLPVTEESKDGITVLTLNHPNRRNALSLDILNELKDKLQSISQNNDTHAVIMSATGPVFSSGHNLKELTSQEGSEKHAEIFSRCTEVMELVQDIPQPVIGQVRGLATAAGCQLAASCDLVVSSDNAKYATPGVFVGLFCSTPAVAVARSIPRKIAMHMLLTGEPISAKEALQYGLINKVVADETLEEETMKLARKVASYSRATIALGKRCFYQQISLDRSSAYRIAEKAMVDNLTQPDAKIGINSFINKEKPTWTHKDK